jgi:peptidoglycan hydrolase-like protein with peptidoglycan-binding domain
MTAPTGNRVRACGATIFGMANEPTLRLNDQSVDGWVEYMQTQLKNLAGSLIGMPDDYTPNGVFDHETERYVIAFQRYNHIQADGVVGDETWNMLHGNVDTLDPHADGRQPHTYVEQTPRFEWENAAHYDVATDSYTYVAMNVGQTPVESIVATVRVVEGPAALRAEQAIGWTDNGQAAGPGQTMNFTNWLERQLTKDENVDIELRMPDENGGAVFAPTCVGLLQALARGESVE